MTALTPIPDNVHGIRFGLALSRSAKGATASPITDMAPPAVTNRRHLNTSSIGRAGEPA
jgi:hypothetical protein